MAPIRPATPNDAPAIREIYAPAVTRQDVATSFELELPSVDEIRDRIRKKQLKFPWLVMDDDGVITGYAYADPHRERAAYQWSAEVSVYVHPDHHRRGIGKALYLALFERLRQQGVVNVYAGITLPNPGSVGLHEDMGFKSIGVYQGIGFKFGRPHDVGWWHLRLQPWPDEPEPVRYGVEG